LPHGKNDEPVPFNRGVLLDQELTPRGMTHEFYAYEKHYFSARANSATTQQMFQDSLVGKKTGFWPQGGQSKENAAALVWKWTAILAARRSHVIMGHQVMSLGQRKV